MAIKCIIIPLFLLSFLSAVSSDPERQFNCPNGGDPKRDERTGKALQCLPGRRSSSANCGLGHSCFFSGFNYQCCPSLTDDEEENDGMAQESVDDYDENLQPTSEESAIKGNECPQGSFSVLSADGTAMGCGQLGSSTRTRECSEAKMFCYTGPTLQLCCERFEEEGEATPIHSHLTEVSGEVIIPNAVEGGGGGQRTEKQLPSSGSNALARTVAIRTNNPSPATSQKRTFDQTTEAETTAPFTPSLAVDEGPSPVRQLSLAPRITKTEIWGEGEDDDDIMGGKKQSKRRDYANAKKYFLEKINDGWPYDDKFYRPTAANNDKEDIFVVRKRNRPTAIVHFPN